MNQVLSDATTYTPAEAIGQHFSNEAGSACTLVASTDTGATYVIALSAGPNTPARYPVPNSRSGTVRRGTMQYAGLIFFEVEPDPKEKGGVQYKLKAQDPNTGYLLVWTAPITTISEAPAS